MPEYRERIGSSQKLSLAGLKSDLDAWVRFEKDAVSPRRIGLRLGFFGYSTDENGLMADDGEDETRSEEREAGFATRRGFAASNSG
jgi:hypothetical protein